VAPSHDSERPPAAPVPEEPAYTGFSARLAIGIGGALLFPEGDTQLARPFFLVLDLGYAVTRNIAIVARGSSWLPTEDFSNEFFGAGAVYRFLAERLYVAGALGLSLTRFGRAASEWRHYVQGLALEADVGQVFPLTTHTSFSLGAHFQFGTPILGKEPDAFMSLQAGIFVAFGLR